MSYYNHPPQSYTPSAPSLPDPYGQQNHPQYSQQRQNYYGQGQGQGQYGNYGIDPDVMRMFAMVDRDRSGFIDEFELQQVLNYQHHSFQLRTIRLLLFLFKDPNQGSSSRIGPCEFNAMWTCLGQWRGIFERFDRDRSGKIDAAELRDALYSIGYAIPPSVLQVLISKYDDRSGRRVELNFDSFVECGMIVKGLTEKFKEKDTRYTGSATLPYDTFMSMIIPFLV